MLMLDGLFWWVGLATCVFAMVAGFATWGLVLADWLLRQLGMWPDFLRVLRAMRRERAKSRGAG